MNGIEQNSKSSRKPTVSQNYANLPYFGFRRHPYDSPIYTDGCGGRHNRFCDGAASCVG